MKNNENQNETKATKADLTAMALGQLPDGEKDKIHDIVEKNPSLQRELKDLHILSGAIRNAIHSDRPQLSHEVRAKLVAATEAVNNGESLDPFFEPEVEADYSLQPESAATGPSSGFGANSLSPLKTAQDATSSFGILKFVAVAIVLIAIGGVSFALSGNLFQSNTVSLKEQGKEVPDGGAGAPTIPQPTGEIASGNDPKNGAQNGSDSKADTKKNMTPPGNGKGEFTKKSKTNKTAGSKSSKTPGSGSDTDSKWATDGSDNPKNGIGQEDPSKSTAGMSADSDSGSSGGFDPSAGHSAGAGAGNGPGGGSGSGIGQADGFPASRGVPGPGSGSKTATSNLAFRENQFVSPVAELSRSSFAVDVDTASYMNLRSDIEKRALPTRESVRIEEYVNYFDYDYLPPKDDKPFSVNLEVANCPWKDGNRIVRIGLKGKELELEERPVANLVFLVDVSNSMANFRKLPLLKYGLGKMVDQLGENDHVSIIAYAGNAEVTLPPTSGSEKDTIRTAISLLHSGGSTSRSNAIKTAFELAKKHFVKGGTNRVLLATDGNLGVGVSNDDLIDLVDEKSEEGIFTTVLGMGSANRDYKSLKEVAASGKGIFARISNNDMVKKVLVEQMSGRKITIAKDVSVQIEFNRYEVESYRLIGYENDSAGINVKSPIDEEIEIGAGHTVTAIYEVVPTQKRRSKLKSKEKSKTLDQTKNKYPGEMLTVWLKYKEPKSTVRQSELMYTARSTPKQFNKASRDLKFAAAVASFGMIMRQSSYRGNSTFARVEEIARSATSRNLKIHKDRREFVKLVQQSSALAGKAVQYQPDFQIDQFDGPRKNSQQTNRNSNQPNATMRPYKY